MAFNTDNNNMINNMNCKVITTNNAGYDLAEAGEIGLLFKDGLVVLEGGDESTPQGCWMVLKVNDKSLVLSSAINADNKLADGTEQGTTKADASNKFNITFDRLRALNPKIIPGAFGGVEVFGWQGGDSRFRLKGPSKVSDSGAKRSMMACTLLEYSSGNWSASFLE